MWLCGETQPGEVIFCCAQPVDQPPVQRPTVPPYKLAERRLSADVELANQPCREAAADAVQSARPQVYDHPANLPGRSVHALLCLWLN
ncbi:MAG: hypothetical protein DCC65_05940 [Planctomycetota bacterium]|nr:MAG: hypothetical protein DCC65_05940 [Planctomycetota bacterium]